MKQKFTARLGQTGLLAAMAVALWGCHAATPSWSDEEKALIGTSAASKMRLCTTDNPEDSLFLRRQCQPLTDEDLRSDTYALLKARMLLTVNDPGNEGVGIAAPQVGIGRRVVAVQRVDREGEPFEFYANPSIVYLSDEKQSGLEGCLSVPRLAGRVERSQQIVVEYTDEKQLTPRRDTVSGFTAIIFQHEIDHLDGILYTDRTTEVFAAP